MSFRDLITADIRLAILQALEQDPDYSHNEHVLGRVLTAVGHAVGGDRLRTELRWLEEQGLVKISTVGEGLMVVRLTGRGSDVGLGRSMVDGVARPRPA